MHVKKTAVIISILLINYIVLIKTFNSDTTFISYGVGTWLYIVGIWQGRLIIQ